MFSRRRRVPGIVLVAGALLISACSSGLFKSLGGLNSLRQKLIEKYGDEVNVNLHNSRYLFVVFVNSPLNNQDPLKRSERAQDAARFVASNYEGIKTIELMWITFMASETRFFVIHYNQGIDSFPFDRTGKAVNPTGTPRDGAAADSYTLPSDPRAPVARYHAASNQTDISVTRIQLEGDMNRGVALVPHFRVAGDARSLGTATLPPSQVVLDFASYTDKPVFRDSAPLEIYCDDRPAFKGTAALLPTGESGMDETVGQFLTIHVPFQLLQQMANSKRVRIVLKPKRFQLSAEDITALQRMTAYVSDPDP